MKSATIDQNATTLLAEWDRIQAFLDAASNALPRPGTDADLMHYHAIVASLYRERDRIGATLDSLAAWAMAEV